MVKETLQVVVVPQIQKEQKFVDVPIVEQVEQVTEVPNVQIVNKIVEVPIVKTMQPEGAVPAQVAADTSFASSSSSASTFADVSFIEMVSCLRDMKRTMEDYRGHKIDEIYPVYCHSCQTLITGEPDEAKVGFHDRYEGTWKVRRPWRAFY